MKAEDKRAILGVIDIVIRWCVVPIVIFVISHEVRLYHIEKMVEGPQPICRCNESSGWLRESITEIKNTVKDIDARLREVEKKVSE